MHKYSIWLLAIFLFVVLVSNDIALSEERVDLSLYPHEAVLNIPDKRLPDYEKLTYKAKLFGVPLGTITASVKGKKKINGRGVYVLEAVIKTNTIFSKIHKVDSKFVSYMDVEKLYTLRQEVHRNDTGCKKDIIVDFDQLNHKAYYKNLTDKTEESFNIPAGVQDILSACYYFMLLPVKAGDRVEYDMYNNGIRHLFCFIKPKVSMRLSVLGKVAKEAFFIYPYATISGEKVNLGHVSAYFSCDKRKLPLFAIIKGPIFTHATVYLVKIEKK